MTSVCLENEGDNAHVERCHRRLEEFADRYRLTLARVHAYWKGNILEGTRFDDLVQADRVHPVSQGCRFMAEAIMEVLL
ncbi:MAG: hypothetical protein PHY29_01555 [Syntrophales bacterium]|nr:hypothetical protein [Syntrophales bacterium]